MRGFASRRVPPSVVVTVLVVFTAVGVVVGAVALDPVEPGAAAPGAPPAEAVLPPDSYPTGPLPPGAACPPFEAAGWVNGPPADPAGLTARLTVVDVWTDWCPVCRQSAPGLMATYQKYDSRGVAFVSLTPLPRRLTEQFTAEFHIPWPCGYGVPAAAVARFGAYTTERLSAVYHPLAPNFHPGHDTNPTLFVIGPDGRVLWNDGQSRPRHTRDAQTLVRDLDTVLARALDGLPVSN